jgi:hypothetical protein
MAPTAPVRRRRPRQAPRSPREEARAMLRACLALVDRRGLSAAEARRLLGEPSPLT